MDALARRRSLPAGGIETRLAMDDGWPLRAMHWPGGAASPGSILIVTGRGDFIEKYAETLHDLTDAGWGVAIFDWRGQGLSGRVGVDAMHGDSPGFGRWLADLDAVIAWFHVVLPRPWFAVGHSMGGHLLLRHLAGENNEFTRAVLLAPMNGVVARPLGPTLGRWLARVGCMLGLRHRWVPGGGPYGALAAGSARQRLLTSDAHRYADEPWWVAQNPALGIGAVTFGWLHDAFGSLDSLLKAPPGARGTGEGAGRTPALERITTPCLVMICDDDGLVDNDATRAAVARMQDARLLVWDNTGHELLRERDEVRTQVVANLTRFLATGSP